MGTTITDESAIDYRSLVNKRKDNLARMYLELHRQEWAERDRQTPRPTFGMEIVLAKSPPKNVCGVRDTQGLPPGKAAIAP